MCKERKWLHRHHYNIKESWQEVDRTYQNNEWTSFRNKEVELSQPVMTNIFQSHNFRKNKT